MNDIYLDEMQNYLEQLSVLNVNILHTIDGKRCFSRLQTDEHIEEIQQRGGPNVVVVSDYYGQCIGEYDDQKTRQVIKIRFPCKALGVDEVTAISSAISLSLRIMFQFQQRMRKDFEDDNCGILKYLDFEKMSWDIFEGPWLDSFYGFDLEIPFRSYLPALAGDQWTDLAVV